MLPRFEIAARRRPVHLVLPGDSGTALAGAVSPYVAVQARRTGPGPAELALSSRGATVVACLGEDDVRIDVTVGGRTSSHRSRRFGRPAEEVDAVGLTLTGPQVTAFTREAGVWVGRSRFDLTERDDAPDPHDPTWLGDLRASAAGPLAEEESGRFAQLGLRDLRLVTRADGTAYREDDGTVLLSATSAGPGWFPTAHASVWALDPGTLALAHRADLYLRRGGRVFGDHAVHLVREADRWLLASSTWGDFHPQRRPVRVTLAESTADLTRGVHVLDTRPLDLPTGGLRSVGVWDPHLVHDGQQWLVGYVSAPRYFRFHPALAAGRDLDALSLRAADPRPREREGTTVLHTDDGWRVLASDRRRGAYPVLDLDLREQGSLDAAYPTNIPWPSLVDLGTDGWLLVGFDGTRYGGGLLGYGAHGDVVLQRSLSR